SMSICDPALRNALRNLKLSGMLDTLDARLGRGRDRPSRAGPPHRSQRAELPHWAPALGLGAKPHVRIWVHDADFRKPSDRQPVPPPPGDCRAVAPAP